MYNIMPHLHKRHLSISRAKQEPGRLCPGFLYENEKNARQTKKNVIKCCYNKREKQRRKGKWHKNIRKLKRKN